MLLCSLALAGVFPREGTGTTSGRKEVEVWIGGRRSRLLPHFTKN